VTRPTTKSILAAGTLALAVSVGPAARAPRGLSPSSIANLPGDGGGTRLSSIAGGGAAPWDDDPDSGDGGEDDGGGDDDSWSGK